MQPLFPEIDRQGNSQSQNPSEGIGPVELILAKPMGQQVGGGQTGRPHGNDGGNHRHHSTSGAPQDTVEYKQEGKKGHGCQDPQQIGIAGSNHRRLAVEKTYQRRAEGNDKGEHADAGDNAEEDRAVHTLPHTVQAACPDVLSYKTLSTSADVSVMYPIRLIFNFLNDIYRFILYIFYNLIIYSSSSLLYSN